MAPLCGAIIFLEVRGVEPLSKITSMSIPTSFPFAFKISPCPRPRRSAQISASLVNLGTYPQAWQIPIPYFVRTFIPMGAERGPALPLIRQRVRSFRQHLFFFRLFYECPRLRPRLATNTSVTLSIPKHPQGESRDKMLAFWHGRTAGASIEDRKHPRA